MIEKRAGDRDGRIGTAPALAAATEAIMTTYSARLEAIILRQTTYLVKDVLVGTSLTFGVLAGYLSLI